MCTPHALYMHGAELQYSFTVVDLIPLGDSGDRYVHVMLYSGKLRRALNLANQSSDCIGEF